MSHAGPGLCLHMRFCCREGREDAAAVSAAVCVAVPAAALCGVRWCQERSLPAAPSGLRVPLRPREVEGVATGAWELGSLRSSGPGPLQACL